MPSHKSSVSKYLRSTAYIDMIGGLVLAYFGLVASSGQFFRLGFIALLGIPGLIIFVAALIALNSGSLYRKNNVFFIICTAYLVGASLIAFLGWYQNNRTSGFYERLYVNTKLGMTREEVQQLAGDKQAACKPYLSDASDLDCTWSDAVYSPSGSLISGGNNYVEIVFNSNGLVISKNASGH